MTDNALGPAAAPAPVPVPVPHPTVAERVARGKAARKAVPRAAHGGWVPAADRPAPVAVLQAQSADRVPELVPIRYGRMLASPFAFYRGAAAVMAADLATTPTSGIRAQLCGDAHLANFGGFASPGRELVFDINDFDETLPGPWEWDVKRLAASFEIAGRELGFTAKERQAIVLAAVAEYRQAMRVFAGQSNLDVWYARLDVAGAQAQWVTSPATPRTTALAGQFAKGGARDNVRALERMTHLVDGHVRIAAHPPLVAPIEDLLPPAELAWFESSIRGFLRTYRRSLPGDRRHLLEGYHYEHMARKVVGVGSVGTRSWVLLLLGRDDTDPLFLQFKEAGPSVLAPYVGASAYADHGQRVVEGQRLMQAASDIFLGWDCIRHPDGVTRDFYARQLWDWKVSVDVHLLSAGSLAAYGRMCGWTLARAHARSGDRVAIAAYLGGGTKFDRALAAFATAYADQNERDFAALQAAVQDGRVVAETGVQRPNPPPSSLRRSPSP
jgi:uncharacterized protein (DUF2252 family)